MSCVGRNHRTISPLRISLDVSTAQNALRLILALISYAGVTGKWGLLCPSVELTATSAAMKTDTVCEQALVTLY